jgi:hypothetical protein
MKTIIDLQKVTGYPAEGIFKQSITNTTLEEMFADYADKIDNVLFTQYGNRELFNSLDFINALDVEKIEMIKTYILSEMLATQYKWEHIIETTKVTYNPVENYNMIEEETTNDNKKESDNVTIENGERTNNFSTTNKISPFESDTFYNESEQDGNATENAYTDTNAREYTTENELKRKLTRSGNIGVTTTQQMLESERKLADYSVIKQIAHSVANCISYGTYYSI